ncbi:hypothetical protein BASA62_003724 [Batrachochytrium salamandrivorans]|nr:hypothetical protein BASA62_003724 [Batrachochytrium salamandrivorans]
MFWRFGFHNSSAIDSVLEREGATLEDVMTEDDFVQEVKSQSQKIVEFVCKPANIEKLLGYITADDLDEAKKFKFPFIASEVFGCEIFAICDALVMNHEILSSFWKLLEKPPPLNALQASYFARVNHALLNRRTGQMLSFIRLHPNAIRMLLDHIGTSAIADLILRLITADDTPEGAGTVKWLSSQGLIPHLFSLIDPNLDPEVHTTASQTLIDIITVSYQSPLMPEQQPDGLHPTEMPPSFLAAAGNSLVDEMKSEVLLRGLVSSMLDQSAPNSSSSLTNGINIIVELIRKYCSEIENAEMQHHDYLAQIQANRQCPIHPTPERLNALSVDMTDLLSVVKDNLPEFVKLLAAPKNIIGPIDLATAQPRSQKYPALGSERLKICELFAEFLHLQYLFTSSPLLDSFITPPPYGVHSSATSETPEYVAPAFTVIDGLMALTDCLVEEKIMVVCINHFFQFKWNNFLHSIVYDMIAKVFNTYSYTSSIQPSPALSVPASSATDASVNTDQGVEAPGQKKLQNLRTSVKRLVVSIFKDAHLMTQITDAQHQNDYDVSAATWRGTTRGTHGPKHGLWAGVGSSISYNGGGGGKFGEENSESGKSKKKSDHAREASDDEEDGTAAGGRNAPGESDTFNDQFARYLCQQLVKDLPDRFLGGDSSDDDEGADQQWMSDLEGQDVSFDIAEAIQMDDPFPNGDRVREPDEETLSDDMASSRIEGDDESQTESRGASTIESSSDADGAFNTKDLERALDGVTNTGAVAGTRKRLCRLG